MAAAAGFDVGEDAMAAQSVMFLGYFLTDFEHVRTVTDNLLRACFCS